MHKGQKPLEIEFMTPDFHGTVHISSVRKTITDHPLNHQYIVVLVEPEHHCDPKMCPEWFQI